MDQKLIDRHQKLLIDISKEMDQTRDSPDFENFDTALGSYLKKGERAGNVTVLKKLQALTTKGLLKPGKYDILKKILKTAYLQDVLDLIVEAEKDIAELSGVTRGVEKTVSTRGTTEAPVSVSGASGSSKDDRRPTQVSSDGDGEPGTSKDRKEKCSEDTNNEDESDPLFRQKDGKGYYDTTGKKGYLLILNSKNNREGTDGDVKRLKQFFEMKLKFETDDPRSLQGYDLTTAQLKKYLKDTRKKLNDDPFSKKYYCFICVIMSHGNEHGVATADGLYDTSELRTFFNNENMPEFAGKPKLFFLQACRGGKKQGFVDQADDEPEPMDVDESDKIHEIPIDADTLLAYATTPGYKSFRRLGLGSWFLTECLNVFESSWKKDHVEEMLITVRERVALEWKGTNGKKQMPCSDSSLTKRLVLARYKP